MAVDRLSITVDADLGRELRRIAAIEGVSVSSWVGEAIADRVRNHLLGEALDAWEAETGPAPPEAQAWADDVWAEVEELQRTLASERVNRVVG